MGEIAPCRSSFPHLADSSLTADTNSSTGSSTPSTPAQFSGPNITFLNSPFGHERRSTERKFTFPDLVEVPDIVFTDNGDEQPTNLERSIEGSDSTIRSDSAKTVVSQDADLIDSLGVRTQSLIANDGHKWDRNAWNMGTIRGPSGHSSWSEVTIPFSKIDFPKQSLIGRGRFGEVHRGMYFGDVAVKFLNMDHVDETKQLEAFKQDVVSFKNTRHENIVLFLGYCMDHQKLGIVMNCCKGRTLHNYLHQSREVLDLNRAIQFATQICQGVSYLHTKRILHKDLRTKNVFIENNNKIVITDFGLFSLRRLHRSQEQGGNRCKFLRVPEFWLCYLAPEMMRQLTVGPNLQASEPFSEQSDIYAFGTIWYELLTGEFPFKYLSAQTIVWQVGRGIKPAFNNLHAVREVKDLLIKCWAYWPADRPDFNRLSNILERLPKKHLLRSSSNPVQMSKSAESLF